MKNFYGTEIEEPGYRVINFSEPVLEPVDDPRYLVNTNFPERDWGKPKSSARVDTSAFEALL
jgi:hypothetical protein